MDEFTSGTFVETRLVAVLVIFIILAAVVLFFFGGKIFRRGGGTQINVTTPSR